MNKSLAQLVGADWVLPLRPALRILENSLVPILREKRGIKNPSDEDLILRPFKACPREKTTLVLVGEKPYEDPELSTGLAFDVPLGKRAASLTNLIKEMQTYATFSGYDNVSDGTYPASYLQHLPPQGVLLLNIVPFVVGTHTKEEEVLWRLYFGEIVLALGRSPRLTWVFLGKDTHWAAEKISVAKDVVKAASPSPFTYSFLRESKALSILSNIKIKF